MGDAKKTAKEKRKTRAAQNSRYRDKKALQGLKAVTVYVPIAALEQVESSRKVGLVVTDSDGVFPLVVKVAKNGDRLVWEPVACQLNMFQKME